MTKSKSYFEATKVIDIKEIISDFKKGKKIHLDSSDLALQDENNIVQFKYINNDNNKTKIKVKPGLFNLEATNRGIDLIPLDFSPNHLLNTSTASVEIKKEFDNFFKNLKAYDKLDILKKRGVLLYGEPGVGKSANINSAVGELLKDKDATIIIWDSSLVDSSHVLPFFATGIEYSSKVKKLVVIIEDIGMSVEKYGGPKDVDKSLLNLLDGTNSVIKVPTFFVATTNYAHNLPEPLVRAGRFDVWIEIKTPNKEERVSLMEFFLKRGLSSQEKEAVENKQLDNFSIASLKEIAIRSQIERKTIEETINNLKELKRRFNSSFKPSSKGGGMLL